MTESASLYTMAEVLDIAHLSARQLRYAITHKYVPGEISPGRGVGRLFTAEELTQIDCYSRLISIGLIPKIAASCAEALQQVLWIDIDNFRLIDDGDRLYPPPKQISAGNREEQQ